MNKKVKIIYAMCKINQFSNICQNGQTEQTRH